MSGSLRVGTSGVAYRWPDFYPPGLPVAARLAYYATRFDTFEVNYSFHRPPSPATYRKWLATTPDAFVFALKAHREVTHVRRLTDVAAPWSEFLGAARALGARLGPILIQLPPSLTADPPRLARFLGLTTTIAEEAQLAPPRLALEARHPSWFGNEAVLDVLRGHGAALVFAHSTRFPYPHDEPLTADFVYLRFHGPREMSASLYGPQGLAPWTPKIARWRTAGRDVYAYFNNDVHGYAPRDARTLIESMRGRADAS